MRPSFPLVPWNGRCKVIVSIPDHCLPFYCFGAFFILDSHLSIIGEDTVLFSACSVLIVVPSLKVRHFFPFGVLERKVLGHSIDPDHCLSFYLQTSLLFLKTLNKTETPIFYP